MRKIIERVLDGRGHKFDAPNLERIANNIIGNSICPLGEAASLPVIGFVTKFPDEFRLYIEKSKTEKPALATAAVV
jgi:NADH-quinone oxidoreductase subunit F